MSAVSENCPSDRCATTRSDSSLTHSLGNGARCFIEIYEIMQVATNTYTKFGQLINYQEIG